MSIDFDCPNIPIGPNVKLTAHVTDHEGEDNDEATVAMVLTDVATGDDIHTVEFTATGEGGLYEGEIPRSVTVELTEDQAIRLTLTAIDGDNADERAQVVYAVKRPVFGNGNGGSC